MALLAPLPREVPGCCVDAPPDEKQQAMGYEEGKKSLLFAESLRSGIDCD